MMRGMVPSFTSGTPPASPAGGAFRSSPFLSAAWVLHDFIFSCCAVGFFSSAAETMDSDPNTRATAKAGRLAELPELIFTEPTGGYASLMISEGANLLYVARQLGHASVAITEKHYTRRIPQAVLAVHQLDDAAKAKSGSKTAGAGSSVAV